MADKKAENMADFPERQRGFGHVLLSILKWMFIGVLALVGLLCVLVYLPPVQDFAVRMAVKSVNKSGTMHISVKKVRLTFPLDLAVDSLRMRMQGLDVAAGRMDASVKVLPLLSGEIALWNVGARDARVNIGSPDSAMYMVTALNNARITDAAVRLSAQEINVGSIRGDGARVRMWLKPDSVAPPVAKDSVPVNWHIRLKEAQLEDVDYAMQLEPIINDLSCVLKRASLEDAEVDMRTNRVRVGEISVDSIDAKYLYYPPQYVASYPVKAYVAPDTIATVPWTVTAERVRLTHGNALYALLGHRPPTAAFDPEYIQASEIEIAIDSFRNRATEVYAPVRNISAMERCGVPLQASGLFDMDSVRMAAKDFLLATPSSRITVDGYMGMAAPGDSLSIMDTPLALKLAARISNEDMRRLVPFPMTSMVAQLPPYSGLEASVDIEGVASRLVSVREMMVRVPGHLEVSASGEARDLMGGVDRMQAELELKGSMRNGNFLKPILLDAKTGKDVNFPPLTIEGDFKADRGVLSGSLDALTRGGELALSASWNNRQQGYEVDIDADKFPIQSIMPGLGVRDIDATVSASGAGLDPFKVGTHMEADVDLRHVVYQGNEYRDVALSAALADGMASLTAKSANRDANFTLSADGNLLGDTLRWNFDGDIRRIDLKALHMSPTVSEGTVKLTGTASIAADGSYGLLTPLFAPAASAGKRPRQGRSAAKKAVSSDNIADRISAISADFEVEDFYWRMPDMTVNGNDIILSLAADSSATSAKLRNHDLSADFMAYAPVGRLATNFSEASAILDNCMKTRIVRIDSIQRALPPFNLDVAAGQDNLLHNYLMDLNLSFESLRMHAANDSVITASASLLDFKTGETRLDSISLDIRQRGRFLLYTLNVDNLPGTLDNFAKVNAKGFLGPEKFALLFKQENIQGDTGFSFGSVINMPDSATVALRFVPYHPIIGYKEWEVNRDNVVSYNLRTKHIDANLNLHNDQSTVEILTEHHPGDSVQEDLIVRLKDIQIADWLAINPFAPPMRGELSADLRVGAKDKDINGRGTVSLADFFYGRQRVGDFDIDLDVLTTPGGALRASAGMKVDGQEALTLTGALNDTTAPHPMTLDLRVIRFPLRIANPFLPPGTATMSGTLNGEMDVTGKFSAPRLNGWLAFDSAAVVPTMLGTRLAFSEKRIPVEDNVVKFDAFTIKAVNDNPVTINGWVDMSDMSLMKMDLSVLARNTQIVGGKRQRSADVYGRAFVDLDARVKGSTRFMQVDAAAELLAGSNVTYVVPGLTSSIANQSNREMVKFVNFADTAAVAAADTVAAPSMLMNLDARLTIAQGTTVSVDLSSDGKNKVQLQAEGTVNYSLDYMNDENFTGRININQGFARYTPPFMSEKMFNFEEGSYVAFNGDMMNPVLNIKAYDEIKANVSQQGADSRQVTFNVSLDVTGTLENMNVVFDLSTPDDLTVENELKSMSPEQRANSAMNLLVTNTYAGPGTKASVGGNPLFSFLESQLNNLAAKTIKGVDLSFGINQLDRAGNASAMSYSYKVSKSLFDDRFKIVVGGNYTTDADADENFAQNLIADISFEYLLNKQGTMYVKLFRHTGYESILEGEITQTGVGFVYKRRIRRLGDIFNFLRIKKRDGAEAPAALALPQQAPPPTEIPSDTVTPEPADRPKESLGNSESKTSSLTDR